MAQQFVHATHNRANSRNKWMEVLGFEEDFVHEVDRSRGRSPSFTSSSDSQESSCDLIPYPLPSLGCTTHRPFPRDITFFHSKGDMVLRPSFPAVPSASDEPSLLASPQQFYINIQKHPQSNTARPDLILHSGPTKASAIMSFAKFYSVTQLTDITLCPPASSRSPGPITNFSLPRSPSAKKLEERTRPKFKFEQLVSTGGLFKAEKFEFSYTLPLSDTRETFEWQHASGFFGRTIGRDSGGLKLVRASTGDVMAVYVGLGESRKKRNPSRVVGMFRFLPGKGTVDLDEEWEILAVMSILSLVERGTRTTKAQKKSVEFNEME